MEQEGFEAADRIDKPNGRIKPMAHMKNVLILLSISLIFSCNQKHDCCSYSTSEEEIIGHWEEDAANDTLSTFDFYSNGTWIGSTIPESNKIDKGKFIVSPDGAVFMRHFGSRHWPSNSDTDKDLRTSIGAFVLFLKDSVKSNERILIDNQEDYETAWIKIQQRH